MSAVRFNTLNFANKLKEAGVDAKQAETMAQLQEEIITNSDNHLVTKQDLSVGLSDFEVRLIKWMVGISTGQLAVMMGIAHFIAR